MWKRPFCALLLGALLLFHATNICYAESEKENSSKDKDGDSDVDVQVEEEKNEKSEKVVKDGEKKEESKEEKKNDDDEEELPKTIRIGGRDIPIERADRTQTAEVTVEISFGNEVMGNITFGLFGKQCPKTVRNFVTLANPLRRPGEGYKGSKIHRIVKGFAIQGGDYINNDGSGGWSIFGRYFRDENFAINHFPFCLSMANSGPNTNGSQFIVPVIRTKWLDGKHVVFGQVNSGHEVVKAINDVRVNKYNRPLRQVWVSDTWTKVMKLHRTKTEL